MKRFVLTIALLFLSGTQARFPWQHEEPQTPIQQVREVMDSYIQKIQEIGRETIAQADTLDIAKQLDLKITEKFDTFSANALAWKKQMLPYVDNVRETVSAELEKDIPLIKHKISPYVETFQKNWAAEAKSFKDNIEPIVDQMKKQTKDNLEGFYKNVQPHVEQYRDRLRSHVDTFRASIAPLQEDFRQKLTEKFEEVKANTGPKAEEVKAQLAQHVETLKQRLGPVIENVKEQLLPQVEEAKAKLAQLWQVLRAKAAEHYS